MRLAFLIGAGASYGAGPVHPHQPPLGRGLFGELKTFCPRTWGRIKGARASLFEPDFERGMDVLWSQQPDDMVDLLNDMGRYFIQFEPVLGKPTRYAELLFILRSKNLLASCAFASLNYECIFEIAALRLGLGVVFNPSPPRPDIVWVVKPHGSSNFLPVWEPQGSGNVVKVQGSGQIYDGPIAKSIEAARQRYAGNYFLPPIMSLFAPGKLTPSARGFIETIRKQWRDYVVGSDYIAIIGCRPNLADGHVWDPILESRAEVWYLSGPEPDYREFAHRLGGRLHNLGTLFDDPGLDA